MKNILTSATILFVLLQGREGCAQDNTAKKEGRVEFKLGSFYTSRLHYYGRTDSLKSKGFFPVAEIWAVKKFYVTAAPVFTINEASGFEYAGTVTTAGARLMKENKYIANICLVKPIYKDNSQLVQSALKWQGLATYTWLSKFINLTVGGDVKFSDNTDYGATAGIDHIFRKDFKRGLIFIVDPSASINAGTQQFTKTSYRKSGFLFFPGVQQEVTEEVKKFNILAYEFSMPVILIKNKLQVLLSPACVIPQNPVKVENRPDLSERGREMFYVIAGAKFSF